MPVLKNNRYELFAQALAKGIGNMPAYAAAGYNPETKHGSTVAARIANHPDVVARVAELQARGAVRAEVTVASLIEEAELIRVAAMEQGQLSAAIAAVREKGILSGKRVQRTEVGLPGEFDHLSDAELIASLQEEAAEIGILIDARGTMIEGPDTEQ